MRRVVADWRYVSHSIGRVRLRRVFLLFDLRLAQIDIQVLLELKLNEFLSHRSVNLLELRLVEANHVRWLSFLEALGVADDTWDRYTDCHALYPPCCHFVGFHLSFELRCAILVSREYLVCSAAARLLR